MESTDIEPNEPVHSIFTKAQKRWIVFLVAFAGWYSTLSSFIYFPAISLIAEDLKTTVEKIKLTVTSYLIVSAVVPSVVGRAADTAGRRPTYIVILAIYLAANLGLALQSSFPALLMLRMVQAAGVSGTFSVAYGVVADIASAAERGTHVGVLSFRQVITQQAPPVGPRLILAIQARILRPVSALSLVE